MDFVIRINAKGVLLTLLAGSAIVGAFFAGEKRGRDSQPATPKTIWVLSLPDNPSNLDRLIAESIFCIDHSKARYQTDKGEGVCDAGVK